MSSPWTPLLPVAMVGTDRHTATLPAWPGPVGALVAQAAADHGATAVLRAAAVLASCSLAGAHGAGWAAPLPAAAGPDAQPAVAAGPLLAHAAWALRQGPERLQHLLLGALAGAGLRLPHALLPLALDLGRHSVALRARLHAVLGTRGHWLAAQRDDWRYAQDAAPDDTPLDARHWDEGSLAQRVAFLQQARNADPQAARERLAAALPTLAARERAELAAVLGQGLGPADEPLLDALRGDRSSEVRRVALRLLLRLPQSAHVQRAAARLAPLLRHERALLRKHWRIDAPPAAGSDWKADGLDPDRPQHDALGERAWWLYQLVRQLPLDWWTAHTGMDAAALLHWAAGTDWQQALLRGWRDVLFDAPQAAWCHALLTQWPGELLVGNPAAVLALLPLAAREQHWLQQLRADPAALQGLAHQVLSACAAGETLSPPLSGALTAALCSPGLSPALAQNHALRTMLADLCCVLHVDALAPLAGLQPAADATPSFTDTLQTVAQIVAVRQALHTLLPRTP